ncbi:sarcosine oxidase subunit gamma family protein [Agrobacterium tumefaciens]|uniref:Sarcosine oxidase subunit gamma family protein n=1 Tax=Agrobacterium tumefaciens TaxID=358 RepID=A0A4D7YS18_AGRTU|nr:sarcosine oxidase subunit gamma [Agrobacterium tumefaciens]QCL96336.1 sarcosine oxidase subunit gamma family protein [Agrobacterium tumefaciens]
MSDFKPDFKSGFRPALRPVLGAKRAIASTAIKLSPLPEGAIIHVLAAPDATDLEVRLRGLTIGDIRAVSPGQWFIVGEHPLSNADMKALLAALEPQATGVDQSQGRVRIRIEGKMAERVLAKGTAVDLSLAAFPAGHSATTLIGHIAAHLTRVDAQVFEVIVLRGFAESLWNDLARMSLEFQ